MKQGSLFVALSCQDYYLTTQIHFCVICSEVAWRFVKLGCPPLFEPELNLLSDAGQSQIACG